MSAIDVAEYLRKRSSDLGLSHSEVAKRSKISRQSWYRLLNAEVGQAKLTTLNAICETLEIDLLTLVGLYLDEKPQQADL